MFRSLFSTEEYQFLERVLSSSMGETSTNRKNQVTSLLGSLTAEKRESLISSIAWEGSDSSVARSALSQFGEAFRQQEKIRYPADFLEQLAAKQTDGEKKRKLTAWRNRVDFLDALGKVSIEPLINAARHAIYTSIDDTIQQDVEDSGDWEKRMLMARYLCTRRDTKRLVYFLSHVMADTDVAANLALRSQLKERANVLGGYTDADWAEGERRVRSDKDAPAATIPPVVAVIIAIDDEKVNVELTDEYPKQNLPHKIELRYCEPDAKFYKTPQDTPPWHICHISNFTETGREVLYSWLKWALPKMLNLASDAGNPIATKTRIDFYLPFHLLTEPVQSWKTQKLMVFPPIGKQRRVAVRSLDRQREKQCLSDMRARFGSFALHWHTLPPVFSPPAQDFYDYLSFGVGKDCSCVAFQSEFLPDDVEHLISGMGAGLPYAVWVGSETAAHRAELDAATQEMLSKATTPDALLDTVFEQRKGGLVNRLHLLFESEGPTPHFDTPSPVDQMGR